MAIRIHELFVSNISSQRAIENVRALYRVGAKIVLAHREDGCLEPRLVVDYKYERIGDYEIKEYIQAYRVLNDATPCLLPDSHGNRL